MPLLCVRPSMAEFMYTLIISTHMLYVQVFGPFMYEDKQACGYSQSPGLAMINSQPKHYKEVQSQ